MIIPTLSIVLFLIFTVLSGFHFYWFFGGEWGLDKVIPSKDDTASSLAIPKFATLIVALGLFSFGMIYLINAGFIHLQIPNWIVNFGGYFIPAIFTLRAIGDFNYAGFFKKIKHTDFAKADSKIFAPLCLFIGIIGFLIQLLGK